MMLVLLRLRLQLRLRVLLRRPGRWIAVNIAAAGTATTDRMGLGWVRHFCAGASFSIAYKLSMLPRSTSLDAPEYSRCYE